jgi:hypothetical protein
MKNEKIEKKKNDKRQKRNDLTVEIKSGLIPPSRVRSQIKW